MQRIRSVVFLLGFSLLMGGCFGTTQSSQGEGGWDTDLDEPPPSAQRRYARPPQGQVPSQGRFAQPPPGDPRGEGDYADEAARRRAAMQRYQEAQRRRREALNRHYAAQQQALRRQRIHQARWKMAYLRQRARWYKAQIAAHHRRLQSLQQALQSGYEEYGIYAQINTLRYSLQRYQIAFRRTVQHYRAYQAYLQRIDPQRAPSPRAYGQAQPVPSPSFPPHASAKIAPSQPSNPAPSPESAQPPIASNPDPSTPPSGAPAEGSTPPAEPSSPSASPQAQGDDSPPIDAKSLEAWKTHCAEAGKKTSSIPAPKLQGQKNLSLAGTSWSVHHFLSTAGDSIRPLMSDQQRFALLGQGGAYSQAHCDDRPFYVWDTQTKTMETLVPPMADFLQKNPQYSPYFQGKRQVAAETELVHYNPARKAAALLLRVPQTDQTTGRWQHVLLRWDLGRQRISHHWMLSIPACNGSLRTLGLSPDGLTFFYLERDQAPEAACAQTPKEGESVSHILHALSLQSGEARQIAKVEHKFRLENVAIRPDFGTIALAEYTENAGDQGHAFLIDTAKGSIRKEPIPPTPYGLAFSPDQKALYVYSSKQGEIVSIPLDGAGKRTSVKAGTRGHAMGLGPQNKLYVLYHSGIEIRDASTLKPLAVLPLRASIKAKFIHIDGSAVAGGSLLIKNGDSLHIHSLAQGSSLALASPKGSKSSALPTPVAPSKATPAPRPPSAKDAAPETSAPPPSSDTSKTAVSPAPEAPAPKAAAPAPRKLSLPPPAARPAPSLAPAAPRKVQPSKNSWVHSYPPQDDATEL